MAFQLENEANAALLSAVLRTHLTCIRAKVSTWREEARTHVSVLLVPHLPGWKG